MIYLLTILSCSDSDVQEEGNTNTSSSVTQTTSSSEDSLTAAEKDLLRDHIKDIRKGIRPFDGLPEESLGICTPGSKHPKWGYTNCEEFIGKDAPNLPEGKYILYAHLSAPEIEPDDSGWKVEFKRECKTTKKSKNGESVTTDSFSQTYPVKNYGGKGRHISPLANITSPGKYGAKECNWTLTLFNTNGEKEIKGFWSVPAK